MLLLEGGQEGSPENEVTRTPCSLCFQAKAADPCADSTGTDVWWQWHGGWDRDEDAGHAQPGMGLSPHRDLILGQTCRGPATGLHWLSSTEGEQFYLPQFNRKPRPLESAVSRVCRWVSVVTMQEE